MNGLTLIIIFVLAIILLIFSIAKLKIHPFLALMLISTIFAFISGIPIVDVSNGKEIVQKGIISIISNGFASTFKGIGLVIIFGAAIGAILEATGAALKIADTVVRLVGEKHPELAMLIMGWIVSIPVFCDSGFVILNPIRNALVKKTLHSSVAMTVCLSAGLYASHVFIPPTPGPIAAANALGISNNLLLIMGIGVVVSIPALIASYIYSLKIGKKVTTEEEKQINDTIAYEELIVSYGKLPSAFMSFLPILLPIVLMAISSIINGIGIKGNIHSLFNFLGNPIVALALGLVASAILYFTSKPKSSFYNIMDDTLKTVGPILFITAAGGVLGQIIAHSGMISYIKDNATSLSILGILFPFILSAILKTAQGSSTVAIVTTSSIMAPLMTTMQLDSDILRVLTVMAIGAGAMTVSHANDSYFWVVTKFGGMTTEQGYKTQTVMTLIEGLASVIFICILWFFLK